MRKVAKEISLNKLVIVITFVGFLLRIFQITNAPPSLNWDEVSHGYNAYSILKTGKDEWGKSFPLLFRAYGDYKLPVYIYLTSIFEYFFGLNEIAVRLPSIISGTLVILFTYLISIQVFKNKKVAIISSLLVAIEPWSLFLSRVAVEANLSLLFIVSGVYFFIKGLDSKKKMFLSIMLFGASVWTYNSARIFTPFLLLSLIIIFRKEVGRISSKTLYVGSALIAILFIPMFFQLSNSEGQARYEEVKILDNGTINKINEARGTGKSRLIHNKVTYFAANFAKNYISHFSPGFLFINGGSNYQFSIPGRGILYFINLPLFYLGLFYAFKNHRNNKWLAIFAAWMFLAPIPSSLTREAPHVLRSITILPLPMVMSSYGLVNFINWSVKRLGKRLRLRGINISRKVGLYLAYVLLLIVSLESYLTYYLDNYRKDYSWSWQYGYKDAVNYIKSEYSNYDKIIFTKKYGEPQEFILFYWPWNPEEYINDANLNRFNQSNWWWVDGFDKFYFVNDWQVADYENKFILESGGEVECSMRNCLLITSPGNYSESWVKLETINFLSGEPAFEILEN